MANALIEDKQLDEAGEAISAAEKLSPAHIEVQRSIGVLLYRRNRKHEALAHFRKQSKRFATMLPNLGKLLLELSKTEEARETFEKAVEAGHLSNVSDGEVTCYGFHTKAWCFGLKDQPWHDPQDFPTALHLQEHLPTIAKEVLPVFDSLWPTRRKGGTYVLSDDNATTCPSGSSILVSLDDCIALYGSGAGTFSGNWDDTPRGCYLVLNGKVGFNTAHVGGSNNGRVRLICNPDDSGVEGEGGAMSLLQAGQGRPLAGADASQGLPASAHHQDAQPASPGSLRLVYDNLPERLEGEWFDAQLFCEGPSKPFQLVMRKLLPKTTAIIRGLPEASICQQLGCAGVSVLGPGAHILPHSGPTNTRLRIHIPLRVPPVSFMRVGSETREWKAGSVVVFDDHWEHEVWINSTEPRVVLIVDVWHPGLSENMRRALLNAPDLARYDKAMRQYAERGRWDEGM